MVCPSMEKLTVTPKIVFKEVKVVGLEIGTLAETRPTIQSSVQTTAPKRTDPTILKTLLSHSDGC